MDQARSPTLFGEFGVPDTVDGRFEMVALHTFLVLRRLKGATDSGATLGQDLFDVMFEDMDVSLREMGAGDMGVGKRVKAMVQAFYGRVAAYEKGLAGGETDLKVALRRNVYRAGDVSEDAVAALARYVSDQDRHLVDISPERIAAGDFRFG